jgi:hypothetical protein
MSPVAVALLDYLHGLENGGIEKLFRPFVECLSQSLDQSLDGTKNKDAFDNFFTKCYDEWKSPPDKRRRSTTGNQPSPTRQKKDEPDLTKLLTEQLNEILLKNSDLFANGEHSVHTTPTFEPGDSAARSDILIYRGSDKNSEPADAVLLLEVAFKEKIDVDGWWRKANQNIMYAVGFRKHQPTVFSKGMLFAVLTIDKNKDLKFKSAKLGVFLCIPAEATDLDFRMSLLWHKECNSLEELSKAFGRLVVAVRAMPKLNQIPPATIDYEYLGPNCCRVGNKVCADDSCALFCTQLLWLHISHHFSTNSL